MAVLLSGNEPETFPERHPPPLLSCQETQSDPVIYLDFTGSKMWELSSRGICAFCGIHSNGDCYARRCTSCCRLFLADTRAMIDIDGPKAETCGECRETEDRHGRNAEDYYRDLLRRKQDLRVGGE